MADGQNYISEMVANYISEAFLNEQIMNEAVDLLYEKLVVFGGGAKYGQIVFMSGGAGSGKGFASKAFMESEKFKIRDVDEWKKAYLELAKLKDINPELKNLNLKNGDDVFALHMFVKNRKTKDKTLDMLLNDVKADRLPNIIFDITGKEMSDFEEVIPRLIETGYDAKNIHVAWVLTDFKVAYTANLTRSRVVPGSVFLDTHQGAAKTMQSLIDRKKMPEGANGRFVVIMNNRTNTVYFNTGDVYKGRKVDLKNQKKEDAPGVSGFYYITVKEAGKPFKPEEGWKEELHQQIVANVPGGQDGLDRLRKNAMDALQAEVDDETNKPKSREAARQGIELVKRDARVDRVLRKLPKGIGKDAIEKVKNRLR
jgi:dephospho-CoA kinase